MQTIHSLHSPLPESVRRADWVAKTTVNNRREVAASVAAHKAAAQLQRRDAIYAFCCCDDGATALIEGEIKNALAHQGNHVVQRCIIVLEKSGDFIRARVNAESKEK